MPARPRTPPPAVALIGDVVRSRRIAAGARPAVQRRLEKALQQVNRDHRQSILSRFLVTLGDECQGLLASAAPIAAILWDLEQALPELEIRWGVGRGSLTTPLRREALGMDGPALHNARAAIDEARRKNRLGGVFVGFGAVNDRTLGALARLLHAQRAQLTGRQRDVVERLRRGDRAVDIAAALGVSRQAVSLRIRGAGWPVYAEGDEAWRALLATHDATDGWRARGWRPQRAASTR